MKILFLGDSLIEYFDWQERFPSHEIANLGVAGESVEGLLSRTLKIREAYPDAEIIFIMTGINNVAMGDMGFINVYRVILEKLSSSYPNAQIFIHSLLPTLIDFISNESIVDVNASLIKFADSKRVRYLDIFSKFIDSRGQAIREYLLDDGVHVSRQGYDVWSLFIEDKIKFLD